MIRTGFRTLRKPVEPRDPDRVRATPSAPGRWVESAPISPAAWAALAKPVPQRNPFLLAMARGESCQLRVPGVCNHDPATTVACHSNWLEHGKSGARKADDQYHVHGCSSCHAWLDQGPAFAREKREVWFKAFQRMQWIWHDITSGIQPATPRERAAAQWALDRIKKIPPGY